MLDEFYQMEEAKMLGIGDGRRGAPVIESPLLDQLSQPVVEFFNDAAGLGGGTMPYFVKSYPLNTKSPFAASSTHSFV